MMGSSFAGAEGIYLRSLAALGAGVDRQEAEAGSRPPTPHQAQEREDSAHQAEDQTDTPQQHDTASESSQKKARTAPGALFRILGLAPTEEEEARAAALIQGVAAAAPGQYKRGATGLPPAWRLALARQRQLRKLEQEHRAPAAEEDEEEESGEEEEEEAARQPGAEEEQTALTERAQLARLSRLLLGSEPEVATGPGDKEDAASLIISKDSLGALTGHILAALLQLELDRGLAPLDPDAGKNPPQAPLLSSLLPLLAAVPHAELKAAFGRLVACGAVNPLGAQRQPLRISSTLKKLLLVRCMGVWGDGLEAMRFLSDWWLVCA